VATILFIEDEAPLRRVIAAELRDAGHTVHEAGNGREGLDAILAYHPDLILCDVNMPVMSGYDLLSELRTGHPELAEVPFVFLSALADRRDIVAGKQLGADDYLTKPVDLDILLATVASRLKQIERLGRKFEAEKSRIEEAWRIQGEAERRARDQLMRLFSSHVSATVAEELYRRQASAGDGALLQPRPLTATILFCDIDDFTAVCEGLEPADLAGWLNGYMEVMVRCVRDQGGIVNKFLGDAVMAVFGVPVPRASDQEITADAAAAVECALGMERDLRALNRSFADRGLPSIGISIGIQTGEVMAGTFGGADRMEYTVVGDAVNTAARLEALAKTLDPKGSAVIGKVLVGDRTWQRLGGRYRGIAAGPVTLKGKRGAVEVYRVVGRQEPA